MTEIELRNPNQLATIDPTGGRLIVGRRAKQIDTYLTEETPA